MQKIHQDKITNASKKLKYKENKNEITDKISKYFVNCLFRFKFLDFNNTNFS